MHSRWLQVELIQKEAGSVDSSLSIVSYRHFHENSCFPILYLFNTEKYDWLVSVESGAPSNETSVCGIKSYILWEVTLYSTVKVIRRFGLTCHFRRQGKKSRVRNEHEAICACCFTGLHGVISQKIGLFISTALKPSNPTCCGMYVFSLRRFLRPR